MPGITGRSGRFRRFVLVMAGMDGDPAPAGLLLCHVLTGPLRIPVIGSHTVSGTSYAPR